MCGCWPVKTKICCGRYVFDVQFSVTQTVCWRCVLATHFFCLTQGGLFIAKQLLINTQFVKSALLWCCCSCLLLFTFIVLFNNQQSCFLPEFLRELPPGEQRKLLHKTKEENNCFFESLCIDFFYLPQHTCTCCCTVVLE